jgi:pyrroloquinoline-quinone synthase
MTLFERLADAQERWNVLQHPFYTRWERGELTLSELAYYAGEYRHAVVALARQAQAAGAEHAAEEAAHVDLWDDFARALEADLDRAPRAETTECADAWTGGSDRLERLGVLYAIESAQPAISRVKADGLREHYGFTAGPATAYFDLHAERDIEHAAEGRELIEARLDGADEDALVAEAERVLRANWTLLDGVERLCAD